MAIRILVPKKPQTRRTWFLSSSCQDREFNPHDLQIALSNLLYNSWSLYNTHRIDQHKIRNYTSLFLEELKNKQNYFEHTSVIKLVKYFFTASRYLLELSPESFSVELSKSGSMCFYANIKASKLFIEVFFENSIGKEVEVVTNIFENKRQVLNWSGEIKQAFENLNQFYKPATNAYKHFVNMGNVNAYELSGSSYSSEYV